MADVVNKLEAKNATFPEKWFAEPMRDQPGYDKKVAKPMDLLTMRTKLEAVRGRGHQPTSTQAQSGCSCANTPSSCLCACFPPTQHKYGSFDELEADMLLICDNAQTYFVPSHECFKAAAVNEARPSLPCWMRENLNTTKHHTLHLNTLAAASQGWPSCHAGGAHQGTAARCRVPRRSTWPCCKDLPRLPQP